MTILRGKPLREFKRELRAFWSRFADGRERVTARQLSEAAIAEFADQWGETKFWPFILDLIKRLAPLFFLLI